MRQTPTTNEKNEKILEKRKEKNGAKLIII